jgi:hypothetical protein
MKLRTNRAGTPEGLRNDSVSAEDSHFYGIKISSAFFGWMTATGISVLLVALVTAVTALAGAANNVAPFTVLYQASQNLQTVSIIGALMLAAILFIAYYCGGFVAGRMARFDGARQGLAVWLWAVFATITAAALVALAGPQFNNLLNATAFPGLAAKGEALTSGGIAALFIAALVSLAAAVLGGRMGMRFHRRAEQAAAEHQIGWRRFGRKSAT